MKILTEKHINQHLANVKSFANKKENIDLKIKITGIYVLLHKLSDEDHYGVAYIGSSINIFNRIKTHIDENKKEFTHFLCFNINKDIDEILLLESSYIQRYLPLYNKNIPSDENVVLANKFMYSAETLYKQTPNANYGCNNSKIQGFILANKVYITNFKEVETII